MIAASIPIQRPPDAKLLVVDSGGHVTHRSRSHFPELLREGDVVIANDAATMPASLFGVHNPTGRRIEVRLAGRRSLCPECVRYFSAVVFGDGDYRTPTEHRPSPPELHAGDRLELGPLRGTVLRTLRHPRLIALRFEGSAAEIWEGLARHGRPIQYAHVPAPLAIWDTWTRIAGPPVAFEPPSAGFILDWAGVESLKERGVRFATITHAAGISSTGEAELDALLPFGEPYRTPESTARLINSGRTRGGRVIAIGTTVVRALEHSARLDGLVYSGEELANQRIGPHTRLRVVDAIVSGTHERGTSHYELLRAFVDDEALSRMDEALEKHKYRTHEFGDSVFLEKMRLSQWNSRSPIEYSFGRSQHRKRCAIRTVV